ncbi:MAG: integration host factor subunit beta [Proteobacteria bacterium]|nr:integration host factor subunit beta [Pseudomonadota bacterium]
MRYFSDGTMNKSELIKRMSDKLDQLTSRDVDLAVHTLIEIMSESLASGVRIEIRGFGTFTNHYRKPRTVRNPKTGEVGIHKPGKFVPHFKPGKDLKRRVDEARKDQEMSLTAESASDLQQDTLGTRT